MYNAMEEGDALAKEQWVVDGLLAANKRRATFGVKLPFLDAESETNSSREH